MPKKVVNPPAAKTPATKKPAAAKAPAKAPGVSVEAKRELQAKQDTALRIQVVKRCIKGDETVGAVAKELSITAGKAAFLIMQHRVEVGEVPAIEGKTEPTLLKALSTERNKANEFSSWGWLAARSGKSEGYIKSKLAELGLYEPKAENIAVKRSASKPKADPKPKTAGKKTVRGNA